MNNSESPDTSIPTKAELIDQLTAGLVEVTFTKLNGDQRVIVCTLREDRLPPATKEDALSQTKIRNLEEKAIVVWDVNINNWRSFRYDRVSKIVQL